MSTKTVPLSVRVSLDDAEYISNLSIPGATTPSDKLRATISSARQRAEGLQDYEGCLLNFFELSDPSLMRLRKLEHKLGIHSELLFKVVQWAEETLAYVTSSVPRDELSPEVAQELQSLERGVADKTLGLIEAVMRMGIVSNSNLYNPTVVSARVMPVLEIAAVIESTKKNKETTK